MNFPLRNRKENLLFIAAKNGNLELVTQLAAQGAEKECQPFFENKHLDVVRHLVEQASTKVR